MRSSLGLDGVLTEAASHIRVPSAPSIYIHHCDYTYEGVCVTDLKAIVDLPELFEERAGYGR